MTASGGSQTDSEEHYWSHGLGHLLWEVSARTALLGEAALAETPLTLPSMGLLEQVEAQPGVTIAEISRRVPKTQQALSQVVARMEKLGFLERRLGAGRGVGLYITEAGVRAKEEGTRMEEAFESELRELFGVRRYEQLLKLLKQSRDVLIEEDDSRPAR